MENNKIAQTEKVAEFNSQKLALEIKFQTAVAQKAAYNVLRQIIHEIEYVKVLRNAAQRLS